MKRPIFLLLIFTIMILISCSKEDELNIVADTSAITFNLSTVVPATKSTFIARYIMEVYKVADMDTRIARIEQNTGTFIVNLETNIGYTCLFWADEVAVGDNTNGTFNALNLKNVTLNPNKIMSEAFYAVTDITDNTAVFGVSLTRATAQVNFVETDIVTANADLQVTFNQFQSFDALGHQVTGNTVPISKTFNSSVTTGTLGTLLTFASALGINTNFTSLYNSTVTKNITDVPLKANYITNIRGNYATGPKNFSFIVEVDNGWVDMMQGVQINVGTTGAPNWIKVADRNAEKGGLFGATAGNSKTDYGYYYQWSNSINEPSNADKAYRACFDFGNGNGSWRLPTQAEWVAVAGNNGDMHMINENRKLKWDSTDLGWKLYDERAGHTSNFVYFPLSGYNIVFAPSTDFNKDEIASYWTSSAITNITSCSLYIVIHGSGALGNDANTFGFTVRCVKNVE